jgi:hypothetical protein
MLPIDLNIDMKDLEADYGSLTNLCRDLVEKGYNPNSTVEVYRDDVMCLKTVDIYETAKWEAEGDHFRKYRPFKGRREGAT